MIGAYKIGTASLLLSGELNNLANNGLALSATPYSNTANGYTLCDVELVVTFVGVPLANKAMYVWFLATIDGANYEDGSISVTPGRSFDVSFPIRPTNTLQRINRRVWLPWGTFKTLIKNDGTGQALTASGNALKIRPVTHEGV